MYYIDLVRCQHFIYSRIHTGDSQIPGHPARPFIVCIHDSHNSRMWYSANGLYMLIADISNTYDSYSQRLHRCPLTVTVQFLPHPIDDTSHLSRPLTQRFHPKASHCTLSCLPEYTLWSL